MQPLWGSPAGRAWMVTGVAFLLAFAALAILPMIAPDNFPTDDALFYMQVARNIAAGHGSTFNTITPTNGYHPLWMLFCAAAAEFAHGNPRLLLRLAFLIQGLLALFILFQFRRLVSRESPAGWLVGAAFLGPYFLTGMYGSEAHLNGALLMLSLAGMVAAFDRPEPRRFLLLGVTLGLAVLARLDNVFVASMIGLVASLGSEGPARGRWVRLGMTLLAMGLILTPYLVFNAFVFGAPLPISGAIKSSFPHMTAQIRNLGSLGLLVSAGAIVSLAILGNRRVNPVLRRLLWPLSLGVLLQGIYIVLFTHHDTRYSWYYVPGVLNLAFLLVTVWELLAGSRTLRAQARLAGVIAALFLVAGLARGTARAINPQAVGNNQFRIGFSRGERRWTQSLAGWLEGRLPPHAGVMVYDYPGALAYYSTLRILPEDGLIGDYAYNQDILREGIGAYLRRRHVEYYLGPYEDGGDRSVDVDAPLYHRSAGAIHLRRADLIVRVRDLPHMLGAPDVGVWRIGSSDGTKLAGTD